MHGHFTIARRTLFLIDNPGVSLMMKDVRVITIGDSPGYSGGKCMTHWSLVSFFTTAYPANADEMGTVTF